MRTRLPNFLALGVISWLLSSGTAFGLPNLTPYQPAGWSDKIVVSKVTGTTTDSSPLYSTDTLYVDFSITNNGSSATTASFTSQLIVDGSVRATATTSPPLNAGGETHVLDYSIGALSAGTHTISLIVDSGNAIAETNENDNQYTKTITVSSPAQVNLTPYQPAGWSDKIVVSKVTGTTTDSSPLYSTDTLYVDFSITNNGSSATTASFTSQLIVDGSVRATATTSPPLNAGGETHVLDYSIGTLSAGTHTISLVVDSGNAIAETNENDNQYTKTITVSSPAQVNLTPYQPAGWSDKIVVSKVTGTTADSSPLYSTDTLYVDFSITNNGSSATTASFTSQLIVDGSVRATATTSPPLNAGGETHVLDYSIGTLSAGTHTISLVVDSGNAIAETNENDNQYTKTITISSPAQVNLTPYQPAGWSDKIVVSKVTGTTADSSPLYSTDTLYVDFSITDNGSSATTANFTSQLIVDGSVRTTATTSPPLNANGETHVLDYSIGTLSAGTHTISLVVDSGNAITETNENDNQYTKTITVSNPPQTQPNLAPYQPAGWSDKIVVSKTTGTTTDISPLYSTDTLYVDFSITNNGSSAIPASFTSQLIVDGSVRATATTSPPLNAGGETHVLDYSIGTLSAGTHTISLVVDSGNAIAETNENDNQYTKTITVYNPAQPASLSITSILPSAQQQKDWGQTINYTITVQDLQGRPIQGANVTVNDDLKSQSVLTTPTNLNGQTTYQTIVPVAKNNGLYQLLFQASAAGYESSNTISRQIQIQHVATTPTVQVTAPVGMETWLTGSVQQITGTLTSGALSATIDYSIDTGNTWTRISTIYPSGSVINTQWQGIPETPSSSCRVRITANYASGTAVGLSPNTFSIVTSGNANCSPVTGVVHQSQGQFGEHPYDHDGTIHEWGCALTCVAMALTHSGVPYQADQLNDFMVNHDDNVVHHLEDFTKTHDIEWLATTRDASNGTRRFHFDNRDSLNGTSAFTFVNESVCSGHPVIIGIDFLANGVTPGHYVLVTGVSNKVFTVEDPGDRTRTSINSNEQRFQTRGFIEKVGQSQTLTAENTSAIPNAIAIRVNASADIEMLDPLGNFSGIDGGATGDEQSPFITNFSDSAINEVTGVPRDRPSRLVYITNPIAGMYELRVNGKAEAVYEVEIEQLDFDGTIRTSLIVGRSISGSVDSYLIPIGGSTNLSLQSSTARVGQAITYTLQVTNSGSADASAVTLSDVLPSGVSFVSVEGAQYSYDVATGTVRIALNTLEAGATATVKITVTPTGAGVLTNKASVSSVETDTDETDNSSSDQITISPSVTLGNISTRLSVGTGDNAMIGGFIITGSQAKTVIVRGIGPSLSVFGVPGTLADPVIEVHGPASELLAINDNWMDDEPDRVQHVIDSRLAPTSNLEAAKWGILNPGAYTVVVRGKDGGTGNGLFEVYDLDPTTDSKLGNISTRGFVGAGDNAMIGGTIVSGNTAAKVLFRAIGPSLTNFGVPNALQDPTLELHNDQGGIISTNDNWMDSPDAAAIVATTIPPKDNRESAILANLPPGQYTAIVRGSGNSSGVAVVEAYQLP